MIELVPLLIGLPFGVVATFIYLYVLKPLFIKHKVAFLAQLAIIIALTVVTSALMFSTVLYFVP